MTTLYGYWRSSAAYRLRIALNLKGVGYGQVAVNLKDGEQHGEAWRAIQPQGLVPVLEHGQDRFLQSPAILEWIDETWPEPALLPADAAGRCRVRGWASVIACDIHPVQNLRILKAIAQDLGQGPEGMKAWAQRWMQSGLESLETMVAAHERSTPFLYADRPGMSEVYLVPQMYNARRWEVDVSNCPTLVAADEAARALPAFAEAAPEAQPDAE
ncbi:maleylacetoacetate isomerase [Maricaulis sp.]|jgi:maleylacetoacetate isomerase|uniref:maleylacetoacetate isomerase n=1 Tax=Maricaulis sp. TaxID=1486257 RepID=UPI00262E4DC6|nr:maleylacetoacetate isomerase [Maricaulis sp.]